MKTWKLEVTLKVADCWIEDGFDAGSPAWITGIQEALEELLPYANPGQEVKAKVKILSAPVMKTTTIITVNDFYNKLANKIRTKYFPHVPLPDYRINKDCNEACYAIECFSNGVLRYYTLINKLSKCCNDNKKMIHSIVSQYIKDFGDYKYKLK